ncbi:MAG: hypothetical protein ACOC9Q_02185 [bacterium]
MTTVVLNTTTKEIEVFSSARDVQARTEIADHKAAADPHPQYLAEVDAADIATSGSAGDLVTGTVPDDRMPVWTGYTAASKATLETATVPTAVDALRLLGYSSPGDGGAAHYKRVAAEPSHAGKIHSNDGAWWELADTVLTPEMFGVGGVDDGPALQRAADLSKALKRPVIGGSEYILASAVDFTEAVIDFSAATIKLADNFSPDVAITLGMPEGGATSRGRYSSNLFVDGNADNQTGTPIAVLIEDVITPAMRFVVRGVDCATLCKIQGVVEYTSVDIHADHCDLACVLARKTDDPLGDATPDDLQINIYGHDCAGYIKVEGTQSITAKINLFTEQGGGAGDRAVEIVPTRGQFTLSGVMRGYNGDTDIYCNMSDTDISQVMFDHLQIVASAGTSVHVEQVGVVSGFVSLSQARGVFLQSVQAMNLSVMQSGPDDTYAVRLGAGSGDWAGCGVLNLATVNLPSGTTPLIVDGFDAGSLDQDSNVRAGIVNLQTDGTGDAVEINNRYGLILNQVNCDVDWLGEVTFDALKKDTSSMTASCEIADDGSIAFSPPHEAGRIMVRERNRPHYFIGFFRTGGPIMQEHQSDSKYDGTTGPLTGITGVDGNVTVSVDDSDGKVYVENRRGADLRFWIVID